MRQTIVFRAWCAASASVVLALLGCHLAFAGESSKSNVDALLDRTGRFVADFMTQLSDVKCTEVVSQTKLSPGGKSEYAEESTFDYLLLAQAVGGDLILNESRQPEQQPNHKKNLPLLVTNGFSTLLLVFHPAYQSSFEFTPLDDEVSDDTRYARLQFRHIKGRRSTAVLLLRGRKYPLDLQGTALIDKDSGAIVRIDAELESSMDDVGLKLLRSEVRYAPVAFAATHRTDWLPAVATVEVETPRQHWRNVHRFTAYRLFSTSVKSTIGDVR